MASIGFSDLLNGEIQSFASTPIDAESYPEWFHEGQRKVMESEATDIVALAANQSGKTAAFAYWLLRETSRCRDFIRANPRHGNALFLGPSQTLASGQAIPSFCQLWEDELQLGKFLWGPKPHFVVSQEGAQRLVGGSETQITVWFPYASDSANIESVTAYAAVWDESGQPANKYAAYNAVIHGRLLQARQKGRGRVLYGTTPYEWGWFKQEVCDPVCGEEMQKLNPLYEGSDVFSGSEGAVEIINWPAWLHPSVSKEYCYAQQSRMPSDEWAMRYMGRFTKPVGAIYDCWDKDLNECEPFDIPPWWDRYVGVDPGLNNTAMTFWAKEEYDYNRKSRATGRYILYATYKSASKTTEEHVREMFRLAGGTRRPYVRGGCHTEQGVRDAYRLAGIPMIEPNENEVMAQINMFYAAIKTGNLVAFKTLHDFKAEVSSYSWVVDEMGRKTKNIRDKAHYHLLDSGRYVGTLLFKGLTDQPKRAVKPVSRFNLQEVKRYV